MGLRLALAALAFFPVKGLAESAFGRAVFITQATYQSQFQKMGLGFQWTTDDKVTVADIQIRNSSVFLRVSPKLMNSKQLSQDDWQMILCHEVGHILGGAPYTWTNQDDGGEYSAEGQADYFAASKCLRTLWTDKAQNADAITSLTKEFTTEIKTRGCRSNQCVRIVATADHLLSALSPDESFSVSRRSQDKVSETQTFPVSSPAQCRLDTMIAGALCEIDPSVPFSSNNQRDGACVDGPGARPACWFHTDDLDGIY